MLTDKGRVEAEFFHALSIINYPFEGYLRLDGGLVLPKGRQAYAKLWLSFEHFNAPLTIACFRSTSGFASTNRTRWGSAALDSPRAMKLNMFSKVTDPGFRLLASKDLEKRIALLEDIGAIKQLKARYCLYCDQGYDADKIAELFAEDGVWDGRPKWKQYNGREAIRKFFKEVPKSISFAVHNVMNPIIEVKGNRARGIWNLFQPCTYTEGNQAVWGAAQYNEEYVKVNGEWKFKKLSFKSYFWTPYEEGWHKKKL